MGHEDDRLVLLPGRAPEILDTSTESSHTADQADFCAVDAQTSSFGGGGRERQRTGAATTK